MLILTEKGMKHYIEFNLTEDQVELDDYKVGKDLLNLMRFWIQDAKWKVEDGKMTGSELLEDLKKAIADENIELL